MTFPFISLPLKIRIKAKKKELMPHYASSGSSGADVRASIEEPVLLEPNKMLSVPTGLFLEIPVGYEVQIRPRSGLACKNQISVLNTPGTVDSDYRGEVCVLLFNHGEKPFVIEPFMRIAQMVVCPVLQAVFEESESLEETVRGAGGFGHTGVH